MRANAVFQRQEPDFFAPLRAAIFHWSQTRKRLVPLHLLLNCQQCLGFLVGLFTGLILFGLLWSVLFALLVSLLAVWSDFLLLAISRDGATPQGFPQYEDASGMCPQSQY